MPAHVTVDYAGIGRFESSAELVDMLESSGLLEDIVAEMRALAPDHTGEGAESIDFELDESGEFYRVSWGKDHFYMYFEEVGTIDIQPHPFMRPVADRYNNS
jgi:HK97 gp10 family phage protein